MTSSSSNSRLNAFGAFCSAAFLLSISYGTTFLLSVRMHALGGDERDAGHVFAVAMLSTLVAVMGSGHMLARVGADRCIAIGAMLLASACLGFASVTRMSGTLALCGAVLGLGWGLFYTVGPILVTQIVEPARRTHSFALLSGSMLTGIGSGPLLGKLMDPQAVFVVAALAALLAGVYFAWRGLNREHLRPQERVQISLAATWSVMTSRAGLSILMVGLGGAIFGTLGSFQTRYASSKGLDYSLFFIGFMGAAITCRLLVAGWVVKRPPLAASCILTALMLLAVTSFSLWVHSSQSYLLTAAILGVGYGLNYSVINGLAANEAPAGLTAQALLLFSLSYFIGVFGFPWLASQLIQEAGIDGMLISVQCLAILAFGLGASRWLASRWVGVESLQR